MKIDTSKIDVAAVFLGFVGCVGDTTKVGLMFDLDPALVAQLAEENGWIDKVKRLSLVSKDGKDNSEWAICQNRALSYIQGHLLRKVLSRIIENVGHMNQNELAATITTVKAGSVTFTARFYADLSAAMQSAHSICYQALGDSASERGVVEKAGEETISVEKLHSAVIMALSGASGAGVERKLLEE